MCPLRYDMPGLAMQNLQGSCYLKPYEAGLHVEGLSTYYGILSAKHSLRCVRTDREHIKALSMRSELQLEL